MIWYDMILYYVYIYIYIYYIIYYIYTSYIHPTISSCLVVKPYFFLLMSPFWWVACCDPRWYSPELTEKFSEFPIEIMDNASEYMFHILNKSHPRWYSPYIYGVYIYMVYIFIIHYMSYILRISHMATPESYCNRVFREINHPFEDARPPLMETHLLEAHRDLRRCDGNR